MTNIVSQFLLETEFAKRSRLLCDFHVKNQEIDKWLSLSKLFDDFLTNKNKPAKIQKIPKIFHQIWLGSPLPDEYKRWVYSWKRFNPGWEHILWDDDKVNQLEMINQKHYDIATNYGLKSDIVRLEILNKFGGIYIDTDFECLKAIDDGLLTYDFFACTVFNYYPEIANGLIGASPQSRVLKKYIERISKNAISDFAVEEIIDNFGPQACTESFFEVLNSSGDDKFDFLILPSNYCYPWPNFMRGLNGMDVYDLVTSDSLAIHHWQVSWWSKLSISERLYTKAKLIYRKLLRKYL